MIRRLDSAVFRAGRVATGLSAATLAVGLALTAAPVPQAAGPPQIAAAWVTGATATSASLHAEVDPEGSATSYRFEYLTEAQFQHNGESFAGAAKAPPFGEEELGEEEAGQPALQRIERLTPATTYRYRIVATGNGEAQLAHAFTTQPNASSAPEECVNAQLRFEDSSLGLPDCRAWELVSPVDKNGGAIQGFGQISGGGVLQASENGEAATFSSSASFGAGAQGAPTASQYIARRVGGEAGWATQNITLPTVSGAYGNAQTGVPYQLFSTDLARGLLLGGRRCGEAEPCPRSYSLRESAGGALTPSPTEADLGFAGASPDLRHVVLSTCAKLTPDATEMAGVGGTCNPAEANLYEWSGGELRLINLLPGETQGTPGARLAAQAAAVNSDGSRVYFTDEGNLYLREGAHTVWVDQAQGGGGVFQTASAEGRFAFFTKAAHLYRYDAQTEAATDLTPAGGVLGVLGAAEDGSRAYYLTSAGLYLWQAPGTTAEIAPGAPAAFAGDYPPATGATRVTPDGTHLAFLSTARLTGYDNTDQSTRLPDSEVYLYSAPEGGGEGALACLSCNPTGERPQGPSTIPGAIANGTGEGATDSYEPRDLSSGGRRLFFDSSDAIVPTDASAAPDVYEWEAQGVGSCHKTAGCLFLISSGKSSEASSFVDASADGRDAFFLSGDSLVPRDPGSADLYDAREGGGFPEPEKPIECDGDACQAVPSPPEDPAPGTLVPGSPNPPVHFPRVVCPKRRRSAAHGKADCRRRHHPRHKRGGRR